MTPTDTILVLASLMFALVIWDIALALDKIPRNTISQTIADLSHKWSVVPFAIGVLCGHWFWPV